MPTISVRGPRGIVENDIRINPSGLNRLSVD